MAKYQPKMESWLCDTCMLNNEENDLTCVSCTMPKPGAAPPPATQQMGILSKLAGPSRQSQNFSSSGSDVEFGAGGGFTFGNVPSTESMTNPSGFLFRGSVGLPSSIFKTISNSGLIGGPIQFGSSSSSDMMKPAEEKPAVAPTSQFSFGSGFQQYDPGAAGDQAHPSTLAIHVTPVKKTAGLFGGSILASQNLAAPNFGTPSTNAPKTGTSLAATKPSEVKSTGFSFSDMAKSKGSLFSFRMDVGKATQEMPQKSPVKPKSPGIVKTPHQPLSPGLNKSGDGGYYKDDDGDHIHFDPIVELPECIDVRTGEEDEEVRFSHRAKLFRYDKETSQWKERGIGDIKLLYNPDNRKYRIVMRREQVLKVCANHYVSPDLTLRPNAGSAKSWVWMAMDASEDKVQVEQLAVRFKMEETAQQFKEAVDAAQENMKTGRGDNDEDKTEDKTGDKTGDKKGDKKEAEEAQKEEEDDVQEDDEKNAKEGEEGIDEDYDDDDDDDV